ncbi:MAG: cyclic 2,3-diphosphoglycerate synthase [Thermodesulfobacteriota bacterium]
MKKKTDKKKIIIMGAAGRDFHNFNTLFRDDPEKEVIAFTATQIPFIEKRSYPTELAGPLYPEGIPIYLEERLPELIKKHSIDEAVFSYSDISYKELGQKAALVNSLGADFVLPGTKKTMLPSTRPLISICAVRTGCGKSALTRYTARIIKEAGLRAVAIRHPMPYGELNKKRSVQRFAALADIKDQKCTIEEMEEYEPLVEAGIVVYAGIDYGAILSEAEKEADIIIWDGGNNDTPFYKADLEITIADPLRPGDERNYYPGEVNIRRAHSVIINKARSADEEAIIEVERSIREINPAARIIRTAFRLRVDGKLAKGEKVLVVEDGPTLTHGGMTFGAGGAACKKYGWQPVDAAPYAVGSIKDTFKKYPRIRNLLPALGYSEEQVRDLGETINAAPCETVLIATPIDLTRIINIKKPCIRVTYEIEDFQEPGVKGLINEFLDAHLRSGS